uniref:ankyrin repeat domain-containing protein 31-like isoform X2 n=1 Tax=Scatophagus argus TaxID=75038 RepID=UPI001ED7CD47|nr:ankyrin repeat domain-containing protein 31-like isoform X2 [Scatophagus argus]
MCWRCLGAPAGGDVKAPAVLYSSSFCHDCCLRVILNMTDGCNQEQERSADTSDSDNDSLSLLCNLVVCQSRGGAGDMEMGDFNSQVGNKEQENEMELNQLQEPESGISSCTQSAACWANSTSQLANVLHRVKIPNKSRLHKRNGKGETLLHKACKRRDLAQVKALVGAGISVNMQDYAGWSALHEASAVGDEAVVEELLESGANVNARSFDGVTPLHDAVLSGCCQVVKLLLQRGSNPSERNVSGLSALDMAEEGNIKELLLTSQESSLMHEKPCEAPAHDSQVGETSSEARCHMQLPWQSGFSHSHDDKASVQSRESGDREGAREPGDIQLGKKDTTTDNLSHLEAITVRLEEVGRKQREISTWPLVGPEDAGRYLSAVTHTHNVLVEVLTKQHLEKDNLTQKYWNMSDYLWQHGNNSQFVTLASHQRILVELLQNQMDLEEVYATVKAKLSTQAPDSSSSTVWRQWTDDSSTAASKAAEAHSCNQNSQRKESQSPYTKACLLRSASPDDAKAPTVPTPPAPLLSQGRRLTCTLMC